VTTLTNLDDVLAAWTAAPPTDREPPDAVAAMLGCLFGGHLIDLCDLDWAIVEDEYGADLAVVGQPGDIVIAPVSVTAKRIDAGVGRFFEDVAEQMAEHLAGIRADHR
jgi:hypothetical protein